jgi:plasmid stability protein
MAQVVVRDIEEDVKARLKRLAARHGRSMEEEIRHILRNAAKDASRPIAKIGSRIAARFSGRGLTAICRSFGVSRCDLRISNRDHNRHEMSFRVDARGSGATR